MRSTTCPRTILALAIVAVAACGSGGIDQQTEAPEAIAEPTAAPVKEDVAIVAIPVDLCGSWTLVAIDDNPVTEVGKTPTLEILEDGSVAGVGGVNRFRTEVEFVDGRLSFGPAAATKMAGPPEAMELESTYLARLGAVTTYEIDGTTLRLWADDNEALTLERVDIEP